MAKIKPGKANEKFVISEFGGIHQTSSLTGKSAWEMRNFRITSDGALEKRTGTRTLFEFSDEIRGVWQGSLHGSDYLIVISGPEVYVRLPGGSEPEFQHYLGTSLGNVSMVLYSNDLFLFDGQKIYRFDTADNRFTETEGYIPLYGDGWNPSSRGPVHQPLNMLSSKLIIRYDNSTAGTTFFSLPFACSSIVGMTVDGVAVTNYSFTANTSWFTIPSQYAHGILTVALTAPASYNQSARVKTMGKAFAFSDARHNSLLLYGGPQKNKIACSVPMSEEERAISSFFFPSSDGLYLPADGMFTLADETHPVHAVFRDRDRAVALSDRSAWALEFPANDRPVIYALEGGTGCSVPGGVTLCGDDPIVIRNNGIFRLRFPSGESDICIAEPLSQEVIEILPPSLLQNGILAWYPGREELWLRDPTENEDGLVWIYNMKRKEWYCFDGLPIVSFFELEGTVGFSTDENCILLPDDTVYTDSGEPVSAYYCSQFIAFSSPETVKRALRATVTADTGGQTMMVNIDSESRSRSYLASSNLSDKPAFFDFNMTRGRFRMIRFVFSVTGDSRARIYRFSAFANP